MLIHDSNEIDDCFDAINILLDATDDSKLSFQDVIPQIEKGIAAGKKLFFEFQFGMDPLHFNFKDQMQFFGYSIAIASFIEVIYTPYSEHIEGVFLYRGSGDFSGAITSHLELQELFDEFVKGSDREYELHLFSLQVLMEYLHRLGAALPEDLSMHVLLNFKGISVSSHQAELLSADHFPYIKPAVKGARVAYEGLAWEKGRSQSGFLGRDLSGFEKIDVPHVALLLPAFGDVPYDAVNTELEKLNASGISYKVIPEDMLNESWHLIDQLIVFEGHISGEGKRMINGFIAAGGKVKTITFSLKE